MQKESCRDGYLIVKPAKSNEYFLGCTNYKKDGTGCSQVISKNKFYDIMGYKPDSVQPQEKNTAGKEQRMAVTQSNGEDDFAIKKGNFDPILYHDLDLNEVVHIILSALQSVSNIRFYGVTILTDVLIGNETKRLIENKFILQTKEQYPVLHPTYNGMHYDENMTVKQLKQLKRYLEQ